jgi:tripartite-type tricarboxylate transporter receptor subunit TctC
MRHFTLPTLAAAAALWATQAAAFPEKPIVMNLCQPAGGGVDRNVQALVPFAQKHLGQPIIVQYRPGAGGTLAMQELKSMAPDGHNLVVCDTGGTIFGPIVQNIGFKPADAMPVARLSFIPWILTAHQKTGYNTVKDLVDDARKRPGQVKGSIADVASADHYTWLLFTKAAGLGPTGLRWTPYGGGGPKMRAMLAGEAEVDMLLLSLIRDPLKAGTVKALAVSSEKRLADLPDTPTFREAGFDVIDGLSIGIFAPAGVSADRMAKLRDGLTKIRNDPEFQSVYVKMGQEIDGFLIGEAYAKDWNDTWSVARQLLQAVTAK